MGEVYRATDSRLAREVAIKVLPEPVAKDPDRLARFEREAKVLASLNHPNIAAIYGLEEAGGTRALAIELVEGATLAERFERGPLPIDEAIDVLLQIAQALEAAHGKGIVHRDLKPANVKITVEGKVKVLDFGLAKAVEPSQGELSPTQLAHSPTMTYSPTVAGVLLGTAAYMAPEQAKGKAVDHRADIWAFGVVAWEGLTGRRLFEGESLTETLAAVMRDEPDLAALPSATPRRLRELLAHCLVRDPRRRLQAIGDARIVLEELLTEPRDEEAAAEAGASGPGSTLGRALRAAGILAAGVLLGWLAARWAPQRGAQAPEPLRPVFRQLTKLPGAERWPSVAPDGESFVFVKEDGGDLDILLQRVEGRNALNLTADCPEDDRDPAFSPDGRAIAFRSECGGGGIFVMGATGEARRRVTDFGHAPAWSPDGRRIAVVSAVFEVPHSSPGNSLLSVVEIDSGGARGLAEGFDAMSPAWSPDGRRIAFWGIRTDSFQRDLWSVAADGSESSPERPMALTDDAAVDWAPVWSPAGDWLYFGSSRGGTFNFWRLPVDPANGRPRGALEPVTVPSSWAGPLALAGDGRRFVFVDRNAETMLLRAPLDLGRGRLAAPPVPVLGGSFELHDQRLSPDGEWVVFANADLPQHLHLVRADGSGYRQLTEGPDRNRQATWSPDGRRLAFQTSRGDSSLAVVAADGSGWQSVPSSFPVVFPIWSPDGTTIAVFSADQGCVLLDLGAGLGAPVERTLPEIEPGVRFGPMSWSPEGRLLGGLAKVPTRGAQDQYVLTVETGEYRVLRRVTRAETPRGFDGAPIFVDSERYVYVDGAALYLGDLAGGTPTLLHEALPGHLLSSVSPSRDGRWLTWIDRADESDIWLMTLEEHSTSGATKVRP